MTRRVLIAVTSHDRMGYTAEQTGLNLEEFACAYHRFTAHNFKVTAASPAGGEVPIDPRSITVRTLGADGRRFIAGSDTILDNTEKLADIDPDAFTIVKDVYDVFSRPTFNWSYKTNEQSKKK